MIRFGRIYSETGSNGVFNRYLGVIVLVKKGESDKKTINRASADWKSTFAVKHLKEVISLARGKEDTPVYLEPKGGTQKKNGYKNIAVLYYDFVDKQIDYLNFTIKLTIGIKSNGNHVQYCVNKVKTKSIVSSDYLTKGLEHIRLIFRLQNYNFFPNRSKNNPKIRKIGKIRRFVCPI